MQFGVITLFPEMFQALEVGVTGRAIKDALITLSHWNPRDFATDKHQSVDDKPYGGGPGMVMMAEPLQAAIRSAKTALAQQMMPKVIYLSPQGKLFNQAAAETFARASSLILVAGRYEGIDERLLTTEIDEEWSIGDYILTGGELGAMVMIDAITRYIPGVIGDYDSVMQDSFTGGLLKYPQYTRPEIFQNQQVPSVLLSGHHEQIALWRRQQALGQTWRKRPDLLAKKTLSTTESALLSTYIEDFYAKGRK